LLWRPSVCEIFLVAPQLRRISLGSVFGATSSPQVPPPTVDLEHRLRWGRILSFGVLAGVVWTLLSVAVLALVGTTFSAALPEQSSGVQLYLLGSNLAGGVWALWLYASFRAHYGPGRRSVAAAGIGWWVIQSIQSSKWVALGFVPTHTVWGPAIGTLPAMVIAVAAGAWCYEHYRARP
jgi:hypothetical protein